MRGRFINFNKFELKAARTDGAHHTAYTQCTHVLQTYICSWLGGRQRWQTMQKFNFMELNCSRCLFASFALGFALQLTSCWSLCPGTNQICQSHESSRMKMKLFLICVIRIKNQFSTHTHKEAQTGCACAYGRVGRGGTTPYAGEKNMAAGLLEAWGGMRHAACIFNVAPAVASMTNHDAWLAKSKCLPLAKESVCISNDSLRPLTPPSIKYDIYIDQS